MQHDISDVFFQSDLQVCLDHLGLLSWYDQHTMQIANLPIPVLEFRMYL